MIRAMLVITDDKTTPEFRLEISGDVKPRAYISTDTLRLTGSAGKALKKELTIAPTPDNPFKITGITAEKGNDLRFELTETGPPELKKYLLTVYNLKKEKGWYIDKLHIKTDSETSPEFVVTVFGVIRDNSL